MIENHRRGWRTCRSTGLIGILVLGVLASSALGAGPALKRLDPPGAQRGTAFTLTLVGRHLEGAEIPSDIFLPRPIVTIENVADFEGEW